MESNASAELTAGSVVVSVSEISDGFLLETPIAKVIDDGTEYAVSVNEGVTEVHVFDGKVVGNQMTPKRPSINSSKLDKPRSFRNRIRKVDGSRSVNGSSFVDLKLPSKLTLKAN